MVREAKGCDKEKDLKKIYFMIDTNQVALMYHSFNLVVWRRTDCALRSQFKSFRSACNNLNVTSNNK